MMDSETSRQAGWFPDPAGSGELRFFDGYGWTNVTRPPSSAFPAFATPPALQDRRVDAAGAFLTPPLSVPELRPSRGAALRRLLLPQVSGARALARVLGTLLLLVSFTTLGYSLWETRISAWMAEQAQASLREQFEISIKPLVPTTVVQLAPDPDVIDVAATTTLPPLPEPTPLPAHGQLAGRLIIPAIGIDQMILVGTDKGTLSDGPGVWESGVFPGTPGNATISGHRTTYGGPFRHLDGLRPGDRIEFQGVDGSRSVFEVRGSAVVSPASVAVTYQGEGVRLTLTTCDPPGTARARLVVQAELIEGTFQSKAVPADKWVFRGE